MFETLTPQTARRLVLDALGWRTKRSARAAGAVQLNRAVACTALVQIDSVNVLTRAHYLPFFSRMGPYNTDLLDDAAWGNRRTLFEYWGHEASLLPVTMHPLFRWRMTRAAAGETWPQLRPFASDRKDEADRMLERVAADGPLAASDVAGTRGAGRWWGWSDAKCALEWLFWTGQITTATRRPSFERVYDITERVLPAAVLDLPTPNEREAHKALLLTAARCLGVATAADLRDYFRLPTLHVSPALVELVEEGVLSLVKVDGWSQPAYADLSARRLRHVAGRALLSPFDPLVWNRPRTARLFGFNYRLEIYTPAARRRYGYYVLPFLLRDELVARVDLRADRARRTLLVQGAFAEHRAPGDTATELASELREMALWLGLDRVAVLKHGDLSALLAQEFS